MIIKRKLTGPCLWLAGLILTSLVAGCGGSGAGDGDGEVIFNTKILYTSPEDGEEDVGTNRTIIAYFDEAMDITTLNDDTFTLIDAIGYTFIGDVSYDTEYQSVTFEPSEDFTGSTLHTATLTTEVTNAQGIPLNKAYTWSFSTAEDPDTTPPTVTSTDPIDGTDTHLRNHNLSAIFNEGLDPSTVDDTSFTLTDVQNEGSIAVTGDVSYINKIATFNSTDDLQFSNTYTATLTTAITDLSGNALGSDYEWTFTTSDAQPLGPAPVNLRSAVNFAILSKTGITDVSPSPITGHIGSSPITSAAIHVTCQEMQSGSKIYGADVGYSKGGDCFSGDVSANNKVADAVLDMQIAYNDAAGRSDPDVTERGAGEIGGDTLAPGLYKWSSGVLISTDVTLQGGPNDVWIFQIAGNLTLANGKSVNLVLSEGQTAPLPQNIFWQVAGENVTLGTGAHFKGVLLSKNLIAVKTSTSVNGRLLSQTAVTLEQNTVTQPDEPVVPALTAP